MKLLHKIARKLGFKNKYTVKEIKNNEGVLIGAVITHEGKKLTVKERNELFEDWKKVQGL